MEEQEISDEEMEEDVYEFGNRISPNYGYVHNMEDAEDLVKFFQKHTGSRFSVIKSSKNFGKADWQRKKHLVTFENRRGKHSIPYDGVPFMIIGDRIHQCQYGSDHHKVSKEKYKLEKIANPLAKKRRNLIQPSKKKDCPAKIVQREVIAFPSFKITQNTESRRKKASMRLRRLLFSKEHQSVAFEHRIYISLPFLNEHQYHMIGEYFPTNGICLNAGDENDTLLIDLVRQAPCIYDRSHSVYRDKMTREQIWQDIALKLEVSVDQAKKRWNAIRSKFAHEKVKSALSEDSSRYDKWPLMTQLNFLEVHIKSRSKPPNAPKMVLVLNSEDNPLYGESVVEDDGTVEFLENEILGTFASMNQDENNMSDKDGTLCKQMKFDENNSMVENFNNIRQNEIIQSNALTTSSNGHNQCKIEDNNEADNNKNSNTVKLKEKTLDNHHGS